MTWGTFLRRGSQPYGITDLSCGTDDGFGHAEVGTNITYGESKGVLGEGMGG